MNDNQSQFRLATIFSVLACISVYCASALWVVRSDAFGTLSDIPFLLVPSIPMIEAGFFAVPIACFAVLILMLVLIFRSTPRAFTALMFFGFVAMAIAPNSAWWDTSLRLLFAMTLSAVVMMIESLFRQLPKPQIVAAALAICVSFGYYLFLLASVACAAV